MDWEDEPTQISRPRAETDTERTLRMEGEFPPEHRGVPQAETMVLGGTAPSFAWLVIMNGPRAGRIFGLNPKSTTIGRDLQCDIILDDESVSRQHAKLKAKKGKGDRDQYSVWDLASGNGTFVNDKQVTKKALGDGDEIKIGRSILVFKQV